MRLVFYPFRKMNPPFHPTGNFFGDLWAFNTSSLVWTVISAAGAPLARIGHGLATVQSRLYLFGGMNEAGRVSMSYEPTGRKWF